MTYEDRRGIVNAWTMVVAAYGVLTVLAIISAITRERLNGQTMSYASWVGYIIAACKGVVWPIPLYIEMVAHAPRQGWMAEKPFRQAIKQIAVTTNDESQSLLVAMDTVSSIPTTRLGSLRRRAFNIISLWRNALRQTFVPMRMVHKAKPPRGARLKRLERRLHAIQLGN